MNQSFDQLRHDYSRFEPEGADTWNPLHREVELWHRVRLLVEFTRALRRLGLPPRSLRVLDVGCGVGRSSRLLLELGFLPENILGIDLRPGALALARQLNPAIRYRAIADWEDWPEETFDLCLQCTAFSSLPGREARVRTAQLMARSVGPAGHIYWWDLIRANGFAGGEILDPLGLFSGRRTVSARKVVLYPTWAEAAGSLPGGLRFSRHLFAGFPLRKSHQSILFGGAGP